VKFEHSINALSRVSFSARDQINPVTGQPTGVVIDNWEDISHPAAKGLDELQKRIDRLDEIFGQIGGADKMLAIFEYIAKDLEKKALKPPKEDPPPGISIEKAKNKGGRPKKVV
jgi:hypothetical protein